MQTVMKLAQSPCSALASGSSSSSRMLAKQITSCHRMRVHLRSRSNVCAAASADLSLSGPAFASVPYASSSGPKLQSRHMTGSPADGIWAAASAALLRMELVAAASIDKHAKFGPAVLSLLAGAAAGTGTDAFTLLQHGLPQYFQDVLLAAFGAWDTTLWAAGLTVAAVPITAWAVRCWWIANMQLLSSESGAVQQLQQLVGQGEQQASSSGSHWVAGMVAIARGLLLSSAVGYFTRAALSVEFTSTAVAAACGAAAAVVAGAPLVLHMTAGSGNSKLAAAQVLAVEAAWMLAMVGVSPLLNTAAAAVITVALLSLHKQVVAPRLAQYQASAGDTFEAHIAVKLADTTIAFDSTLSEDPVKLVAAKRTPDQQQSWEQLTSDAFWEKVSDDDAIASRQEAATKDDATASSSSASSSSSALDMSELRGLAKGLRSWLSTPSARWEPLLPFVAEAACGMYLGEKRTIQVFNPKATGYWNPSYSWWQPTADVAAKFKGQMPSPGDVFWYPVADGAYVPTRVAAVGEKYVELDANYGVTDTFLQLEVELVRLRK